MTSEPLNQIGQPMGSARPPLTVHIEELHDGRYIAWAVWPNGDVDNLVSPCADIRSHGHVYEQIGYLMLDSGEADVLVRKHRRAELTI